ncbi:leucine--tRNA ligase [Candidatus Shapirobacteria bacterium]|nr:leucine--tRNA ligase [Candidatus Shapirobacteria bacterium]
MNKRDFKKQEKKWQAVWEKQGWYKAVDSDKTKKKKYVLVEFPYPSGEGLHVGHAFSMTGADVYARFCRMSGFNVLFPMGWDAFGLPTENYAIKTGIQPQLATKNNTDNFRRQMKKLAFSFDWEREVNTTDPDYYAWTQWIFIQLFKKGLAYKEEKPINWCPSCKIGLANEEVINGKCERCGAETGKKNLSQWIVKITDYADRLASGLEKTVFIQKVKAAQINWIGRSTGARIKFKVQSAKLKIKELEVFTTRPDTLWGATFLVVAPEHPLVAELLSSKLKAQSSKLKEIREYIKTSQGKSELERAELEKEKNGVFSGVYALNPVNNEKIPVWISDFALISYGTGAIMAVPAHDSRDHAFAKKYELPIIPVVKPSRKWDFSQKPYEDVDHGKMINSGPINGLKPQEAIKKTIKLLVEKKAGKRAVDYHLRDWIFSRQHYWGEPIPMIDCSKCGWVPVDEADLPIRLPEVEKYEPTDTGESPLANIKDWVETTCPECGGKARRETDTMPNWAGSDWYYLAYCFANKLKKSQITNHKEQTNLKYQISNKKNLDTCNLKLGTSQDIFSQSKNILSYWLPVDVYLGGDEHNTLHLLYSRFIYQFLGDLGVIPKSIPEPYYWRLSHGVILGTDNRRMSKSHGNTVEPDRLWRKYGVDVLRTYMMFMGPFEGTIAWNDNALKGVVRFLDRFYSFVLENKVKNTSKVGFDSLEVKVAISRLVKKVTTDLSTCRFNTSIAALMKFLNQAEKKKWQMNNEQMGKLIKLLAPFAPYLSEELWEVIGGRGSVHASAWPKIEEKHLKEENITIAIQVNGRLRGTIAVKSEKLKVKSEVEKQARKEPKVAKYLKGKKIVKTIFVPGRLINFVVK